MMSSALFAHFGYSRDCHVRTQRVLGSALSQIGIVIDMYAITQLQLIMTYGWTAIQLSHDVIGGFGPFWVLLWLPREQ